MGASTMTNSTLASQVRSVFQVVAPSAMPPMVSMPPRIARQHASSDGASRDAWTAAPLPSQRPHWTVALASHLAVPILAWRNSLLEHSLPDELMTLFSLLHILLETSAC